MSDVFSLFFFKQKTAYEMRISDWSSDVCSSDLVLVDHLDAGIAAVLRTAEPGGAPADQHLAPVALIGAGEDLHQRRLAGRAVADQAGHLARPQPEVDQLGRATSRDRVCQSESVSVVAVSSTNKNTHHPYTK